MRDGDAGAWGVAPGFHDLTGQWRQPAPETVESLLAAMGAGGRPQPPPSPVRLVQAGHALPLDEPHEVETEDGARVRADREVPPLPPGYHLLRRLRDGADWLLVSHPPAVLAPPPGRSWAWAAQLYAVRSRNSWGVGDLADLGRLARWAAGTGAAGLLVNPLHAPLPRPPLEPSPYYPSSRRFRNPLYIAVEDVPGADRLGDRLEPLVRAGQALNRGRQIDRRRAWNLKLKALEQLWEGFAGGDGDPDFAAYCEEQGDGLEDYATFCTLAERRREPWRSWPSGLRHPASPAVVRYRNAARPRVRFHMWLQWLLDRQLKAAAAAGSGLVHDLAVGVNPDGADAWLWQDVLVEGFRVGSPPDMFQPDGQDWGLPPFDPWRLRSAAYLPFIETLRSALRHGAGLRVDHVMGLFRLYWIPPTAAPAEGAYVLYPDQDLLALLCLESHRAGAYVVGEDLGTVEERTRQELGRRGVLSYRLLYFEDRPPAEYPEAAMAAVTTHDLPTIAGVLAGGAPNGDQLRGRLERFAGVQPGPDVPVVEAVVSAYAALAKAPSRVVTVTLEDALGLVEQPNRPGTVGGDNWSLALPGGLERLETDPAVERLAAAVRAVREAPAPLGPGPVRS